jgi:hypothetical protein
MVPGEGWSPIREKLNELSFIDMGLDQIKGQVADAASVERCREHGGDAVDGELPVDPHAKFASSFLKLPRIYPATRR